MIVFVVYYMSYVWAVFVGLPLKLSDYIINILVYCIYYCNIVKMSVLLINLIGITIEHRRNYKRNRSKMFRLITVMRNRVKYDL